MVHSASQLAALPSRRMSSLIAPREHGAWGLLFVPLATGGALGLLAGGNGLPLMALAIAALALFWLRTPVESWLGTGLLRAQGQRERRVVGIAILLLAAIASVALASLFSKGRNRGLLILAPIAVSTFLAQAVLRKLGRRTRMLSQIVGTLGLTVTAPAAYYVTMGTLDRIAWALWMANLLFAGDQIHFVQLRLRSVRASGWAQKFVSGRGFFAGQMLLATALIVAWRFAAFACARCARIPATIDSRHLLVFRAPETSDGPQARLDRTRAFGHLRHLARRRIPSLTIRGFPQSPRTSAGQFTR
jgi:hypothetical protein